MSSKLQNNHFLAKMTQAGANIALWCPGRPALWRSAILSLMSLDSSCFAHAYMIKSLNCCHAIGWLDICETLNGYMCHLCHIVTNKREQNKKIWAWSSKWRRIRNDQSKLATDGGCDINRRRGNEVVLSFRGGPLADKWLWFLSSASQLQHLLVGVSLVLYVSVWLQQVTALLFMLCLHVWIWICQMHLF